MMATTFKTILGLVVLLGIVYLSLDIQPLDRYQAQHDTTKFDAQAFAESFWQKDLPASVDAAMDVSAWLAKMAKDPNGTIERDGKTLGISKTHYFMLKGKGVIRSVQDEYLVVALKNGSEIHLATDFIFGNAVRDGSGRVNINDFLNMTQFNNVSVEINKLIKAKVVTPLKEKAKPGQTIEFAGAAEINEDNLNLKAVRLIPVSVTINDDTIH